MVISQQIKNKRKHPHFDKGNLQKSLELTYLKVKY